MAGLHPVHHHLVVQRRRAFPTPGSNKSLGRIHLVLDNLDNLRGKIEDEEYYRFKAELLCLRAYFYDWACKVYATFRSSITASRSTTTPMPAPRKRR